MLKLIFLDIDGVMNAIEDNPDSIFPDNPSKYHMKFLNRIIKETGAHVVISSCWRHHFNTLSMWRFLDALGFEGKVVGSTQTLDHPDSIRGEEIQAWLDGYKRKPTWDVHYSSVINYDEPINSFVIIDDDRDMGNLIDKLVHCDSHLGLGEAETVKAIEILNK